MDLAVSDQSYTASYAGEMARRTPYSEYNDPLRVGMSLSFLESVRKMSDGQSEEEKVVQLQK